MGRVIQIQNLLLVLVYEMTESGSVIISNLPFLIFGFTLSQGNKYWRFEGDVLDEDYPRDISVGFDGVPDNVDAAFAIPAPSHRGKEKAYFFKGIML